MVNKLQSETLGKRELNNSRIRGRIIKRVYDNLGCNITFIIKGNGIPKNSKSLRKRIAELQKTDYFQALIPWNEECFYIYLKKDPDFLSFRTFCRTKNDLSIFCDHNDYIKNSNAYKEFTNRLGVNHIARLGKDNFKKIPMTYHKGLNPNQDSRDQILRKLLCIYHKKMLIYLREEKYQSRKLDTYVRIDVNARMRNVTLFILEHVEEFAKKIHPYDESEFLKFAKEIAPILDTEHETTSTHLINSMEYLTTITDKSKLKRRVFTLNEQIEFWQFHLDEYFDPENPRNIPNWMIRILGQ
jgi:hypothetical protein